MKIIRNISLKGDRNEELLPGFSPDFPYIATCAELDKYADPSVPWHWHDAVELFYMESGSLEYTTPNGTWVFPAGSGGFVNTNVLHTTRILQKNERNIQLLHLFDPVFLSGERGNSIERKYILPLSGAGNIEIIPLLPEDPACRGILQEIRATFDLSDDQWGYEFKLRTALAEIWLKLSDLARPMMDKRPLSRESEEKIKAMMSYIREHYCESIYADQLAEAAFVSRRVCFRLFQEKLYMTPAEYIRDFRLRKARDMLIEGSDSITQIAYNCGLGTSSYFGKLFRQCYGCSPLEYRRKRHDSDNNCPE